MAYRQGAPESQHSKTMHRKISLTILGQKSPTGLVNRWKWEFKYWNVSKEDLTVLWTFKQIIVPNYWFQHPAHDDFSGGFSKSCTDKITSIMILRTIHVYTFFSCTVTIYFSFHYNFFFRIWYLSTSHCVICKK